MADIMVHIVEDTPEDAAPDEGNKSDSVDSGCNFPFCQDEREQREAWKKAPEGYEEWKRQQREEGEDEWERKQKIVKPWLYETQHPTAEPPDINYREIILDDQDEIDLLFEDEDLHFTERCLRYQKQDVSLEYNILAEYKEWAASMLKAAKNSGDSKRETFFQDLYDVVAEDNRPVFHEWVMLENKGRDRVRRRVAQRLGIPANHEDWTTEDRQRFYEDHEYVRGWPFFERWRYQAAQRLGIPENHEEWTTEDRQRFYKDDENVYGWPSFERERYQAAQRLGIPENHEEWTIEDKRRYVDSNENVYLWRNKFELLEELQNIDREALVHSLKNEQEVHSQDESNPPTISEDESTGDPDLVLDNMDEDDSSPTSKTASPPSETGSEEDVHDKTNDQELDADASEDQPSSLIIKCRLEQGNRYYRPLATILLILLLNEVVKQQLHL